MLIYKDILSGDELISDSYNIKEVHDGSVIEVDCTMITIGAVDVDIGANASAEEAEEGLEDTAKKENDIIYSFQLQEQPPLDKKAYKEHLGRYYKKVKAKLDENGASAEEKAAFAKACKEVLEKVRANIKDYEFLIGESMDEGNGMLVLLNYREDGVTPYVTYFKHGLVETKV
ncbi:microtubule/calcium-binding protein [Thelonectria olida]|uniref:Translationally-controlled tumor protein homolog n=1 Tax=Thelonectria olida TaxID=1576542 RepID=A0A9P9APP4_9HYPO|nr:microtubule/calcium-binding protein [Thelonectria olida]